MKIIKAYDLPTRIFHWLFAGLFVVAFFIAKAIDDDSPLYSYHMLAGLLMCFLVVERIIWGVIGSKYARFSSFRLAPRELLQYFTSVISSTSKRYLGHNPASSYIAIIMFILTFGLGLTGILMGKGIQAEFFEEVHELCANLFIIAVILHVTGVIYHNLKHRDGLIFSMVNGNKEEIEGEQGIRSTHFFVALIFLGLFIGFGIHLYQNYDSSTQKLNLFGTQIELSEADKDHDDD